MTVSKTKGIPWKTCCNSCCSKQPVYIICINDAFTSVHIDHAMCTYAPRCHHGCWLLNCALLQANWSLSSFGFGSENMGSMRKRSWEEKLTTRKFPLHLSPPYRCTATKYIKLSAIIFQAPIKWFSSIKMQTISKIFGVIVIQIFT